MNKGTKVVVDRSCEIGLIMSNIEESGVGGGHKREENGFSKEKNVSVI